MRTIRFPIAGLMGSVLVVALGLAALRNASQTWSGAMFLLTCAVLGLAVVGFICRGDGERAWWLGFALFGWGYLVLAFWSALELPTMALLDTIAARVGVTARFSGGMGGGFGGGPPDQSPQEIAHCLWALAAALLGGVIARALFGGPRARNEKRDACTPVEAHAPVSRWFLGTILGLAGCLIITLLGLFGSRSASGFWAGATFFLTCGLLGMTVLGVAGCHGKGRQLWLGAAIFGIGYMTIAFGRSLDRETWPSLPSDHLLNAVRPWFPLVARGFPTSSDGATVANARIRDALEQPVPLRFPDEVTLEDLLKTIRAATTSPYGQGIPIYVDPIGLQEAETTLTSTVRIDLEGVALKTSLRLCLEQLDLTYSIRDGLLLITSAEREVTPVYQDSFLIVGHCLLGLLAAGFGTTMATLVCDMRSEYRNKNT